MGYVLQVLGTPSGTPVETFPVALPVKAGAASTIKAGAPVIVNGSQAGYVTYGPNGMSTSNLCVGVAATDSTETVAADGTVLVYSAPLLLVKCKAATPANLTAAMKLTNKYTIAISGSSYLLDQGTTSSGVLTLIDFDNTTDGNCTAVLACNKFQA